MAKRAAAGSQTQAGAIREAFQELGIDAPAKDVAAFVDNKYQMGLASKTHYSTIISVERGKARGGKKRVKKRKYTRRETASAQAGSAAPQRRSSGARSTVEVVSEFVQRVAGGNSERALQILQAYKDLERRLG